MPLKLGKDWVDLDPFGFFVLGEYYYMSLALEKDSYRYGWNNLTLIFENLKPVEKSKNHLNITSS